MAELPETTFVSRGSNADSGASVPDSRGSCADPGGAKDESRESRADSQADLKSAPRKVDRASMKLLPPGRSDLIAYARSHIEAWSADPGAVGLTSGQVAELQAQCDAAAAAFADAGAARSAAKGATLISNTMLGTLRTLMGVALAGIKVFASEQGGTGGPVAEGDVYAAAQIDVPLKPSVLPAPGQVRNVRVQVDSQGRPTIEWKPPHPRDARERAASSAGLVYAIQRSAPGEGRGGGWTLAEATADTSFTDEPLAAGQTRYMIRAMRGRAAGPWSSVLTVSAGMGGMGGDGERARGMKIAA
jgi:hypothetical protein